MNKAKILAVLGCLCLLTGCFQIEGVHVLQNYGESDNGSYRITMNRATYDILRSDDKYSGMVSDLKRWSRPTTRIDGDSVHLEDTSGYASMEHFYDSEKCSAAPERGYRDCRYIFKVPPDFATLVNWSIDWEVVLQPGMRVISSNHQRTRREDGRDELIWYFDGNVESSASVDFTVRVPSEK